MRVELPRDGGEPRQHWFPGACEARLLYHVHDGTAFGGGCYLLVGRASGVLEIIAENAGWSADPTGAPSDAVSGSFHIRSWWTDRRQSSLDELAVDSGVPQTSDDDAITAIEVVERPGPELHLLIATRNAAVYVVTVAEGRLRLRQRVPMQSWIQWIIRPSDDDPRVTCVSRSGDIVRLGYDPRDGWRPVEITAVSAVPTSAMPYGDHGLLLGTTTGLLLVDGAHPEGLVVPVTRAAVLSLDQVALMDGEYLHHYVAIGLEDGRLRIADGDRLHALAGGAKLPEPSDHNFAIDMTSAVLAVEVVPVAGGAYLLAVLRDFSVRLFHVTGLHHQRRAAAELWRDHIDRVVARGPAATRLDVEIEEVAGDAPAGCSRDAWNYMLIDVVLPRLRGDARISRTPNRNEQAVVQLACSMAAGADRRVLHRLSRAMRELTDVLDRWLELSRAILGAVRAERGRRWEAFIDSHLRELNALARRVPGDDRTRLLAWAGFVRKFIRHGHAFSANERGLLELVDHNESSGRDFDALVYLARLAQRGYDLRWDTRTGAEIAEIHTVDCGAAREIIVVVTVDAQLMFVDAASGDRLALHLGSGGPPIEAFAPFAPAGIARTLASAAVREDIAAHLDSEHRDKMRLRVVMSCTGPNLTPPGLAVIDIGVAWPVGAAPRLELDEPEPVELVTGAADRRSVERLDRHAFVHSVRPLLPHVDAFVVGLATRERPLGLLRRSAERWTLELAVDRSAAGSRDGDAVTRSSLAPGKVPTRALAVAARAPRSGYLVVAGSDDGVVRAVSFTLGSPVADWQIDRWEQLADAVTSAVLCVHRENVASTGLFSCYLATAAGDVFALSIFEADPSAWQAERKPFAGYDAQPLWRETHDGPVLAMRLWTTALYRTPEGESDSVLAVATEKGRLCLYDHAYNDKGRLSASSNYYFRGMRFGRVATLERLRGLVTIERDREFVAAGPGGQLYRGRLVYMRESADSKSLAWGGPDPSQPYHELGSELWTRLQKLFDGTTIHKQFTRSLRDDEIKLALCDLVRLDGGGLSAYALRRHLLLHEPWQTRSPRELRDLATRRLGALDPERPDDVEQIKVIIKSLCRAFLYRNLDSLRDELVAQGSARPAQHAEAEAACKVVSDYLTRNLAYASSAAARLRIVAIKELLSVPVLRHMAHEEREDELAGEDDRRSQRGTRHSIGVALASCLGDDDRLVRIEALRAIALMLRNVGVMANAATDRDKFITALFPRGLGSLQWLLELLVDGLRRLPSVTHRIALISDAWYFLNAPLPLFRIFRDHTLALCDYVVRESLGREALAICFASLRRPGAAEIRARIEHYYLLPALPDRGRYVDEYRRRPADAAAAPAAVAARAAQRAWYELPDRELADRHGYLLDQLAAMWGVGPHNQLEVVDPYRPSPLGCSAALAALEATVQALAALAAELGDPRMDPVKAQSRLGELRRDLAADPARAAMLTAPVHAMVLDILATWGRLFDTPPPETHMKIPVGDGEVVLGKLLADAGATRLFEVAAAQGTKPAQVIRALQRLHETRRFIAGARHNQQLATRSPRIVDVVAIHAGAPYPAYVMPHHRRLELQLSQEFCDGALAPLWAELVAEHVGEALRAAHAEGHVHGDVNARNILVDGEDDEPSFYLGEFALPGAEPEAGARRRRVPEYLSQKARGAGREARRQWDDIVALSLVVYRILTGASVNAILPDKLPRYLEEVDKLRAQQRVRIRNCPGLVDTLHRVFADDRGPFYIDEFLDGVTSRNRSVPTQQRWREKERIVFLAADPLDSTRFAMQDEVRYIDQRLTAGRVRDAYQLLRDHGTVAQLADAIRRYVPTIVHLSGPGMQGEAAHAVARDAIAALTGTAGAALPRSHPSVRCLVLSGCESPQVARAIVDCVDVVIGVAGMIEERAAFAGAFYHALAGGAAVQQAFEAGRLEMTSGCGNGSERAWLVTRSDVEPAALRLVAPADAASPPRNDGASPPRSDGASIDRGDATRSAAGFTLTHEQLRRLREVIADVFSPEDLVRAVGDHLEEPLHNLASRGDHRQQVDALVEACRRRGWLGSLLRAVMAERGDNPDVARFVRQLGLSAA